MRRAYWIPGRILLVLICGAGSVVSLWAGAPDHPVRESACVDVGIEVSELAQNRFRNIGTENYTFIAGMRRAAPPYTSGLRCMVMNVHLSSEHLADARTTLGLSGNTDGLYGSLSAVRLYHDWYPVVWSAGPLQVRPVFSVGIGWHRTVIRNPRHPDPYDFSAGALSVAARMRIAPHTVVWVEFPFLDVSLNVWRNRSASMEVGDLTISRPDVLTVFGWIGMGFSVPFSCGRAGAAGSSDGLR
jgi:hypothetical protein